MLATKLFVLSTMIWCLCEVQASTMGERFGGGLSYTADASGLNYTADASGLSDTTYASRLGDTADASGLSYTADASGLSDPTYASGLSDTTYASRLRDMTNTAASELTHMTNTAAPELSETNYTAAFGLSETNHTAASGLNEMSSLYDEENKAARQKAAMLRSCPIEVYAEYLRSSSAHYLGARDAALGGGAHEQDSSKHTLDDLSKRLKLRQQEIVKRLEKWQCQLEKRGLLLNLEKRDDRIDDVIRLKRRCATKKTEVEDMNDAYVANYEKYAALKEAVTETTPGLLDGLKRELVEATNKIKVAGADAETFETALAELNALTVLQRVNDQQIEEINNEAHCEHANFRIEHKNAEEDMAGDGAGYAKGRGALIILDIDDTIFPSKAWKSYKQTGFQSVGEKSEASLSALDKEKTRLQAFVDWKPEAFAAIAQRLAALVQHICSKTPFADILVLTSADAMWARLILGFSWVAETKVREKLQEFFGHYTVIERIEETPPHRHKFNDLSSSVADRPLSVDLHQAPASNDQKSPLQRIGLISTVQDLDRQDKGLTWYASKEKIISWLVYDWEKDEDRVSKNKFENLSSRNSPWAKVITIGDGDPERLGVFGLSKNHVMRGNIKFVNAHDPVLKTDVTDVHAELEKMIWDIAAQIEITRANITHMVFSPLSLDALVMDRRKVRAQAEKMMREPPVKTDNTELFAEEGHVLPSTSETTKDQFLAKNSSRPDTESALMQFVSQENQSVIESVCRALKSFVPTLDISLSCTMKTHTD